MYNTFWRKSYTPHMATDEYITIGQCVSCVKNGRRHFHERRIQLSPASDSRFVLFTGLLGPIPKIKQENSCNNKKLFETSSCRYIHENIINAHGKHFSTLLDDPLWQTFITSSGQRISARTKNFRYSLRLSRRMRSNVGGLPWTN